MAGTSGGPTDTEYLLTHPFVDTRWLRSNNLDENNVLEYFSRAESFYDRNCDNEQLKMQQRIMGSNDVKTQLQNMKGIQYHLAHKRPKLFIIQKIKRDTPESSTTLAFYYILDGTIYMAPDLYSVVSSRFRKCVYHTSQVLNKIYAEAKYDVLRGHSYKTIADYYESDYDLEQNKKDSKDAMLSSNTHNCLDSVIMSIVNKDHEDKIKAEQAKQAEQAAGDTTTTKLAPAGTSASAGVKKEGGGKAAVSVSVAAAAASASNKRKAPAASAGPASKKKK